MIDPIPPQSSPTMADDVVRSSSSFSTTTFRNYIRIPILISFLICFGSAEAHDILLPSQRHNYSLPRLSSTCSAPNPNLYYRPVIGIVTHPGDGASGRLSNATTASSIAASYVRFVESAGARVIPLIYNEPSETLLKKLELVNGVLFTGGWAKTGLYFETVEKIFKKVLEKNDGGNHFPLYGICLGFELISMIVSKDHNILEEFSASNQATKLDFFKNANLDGSLFQRFPPDLLKKLSTDCLVMQNHHYGISPERLLDNGKLSEFFEILTTCTDEYDQVYISTVRSRNYPVTGFQWHPEKNAFEWAARQKIPHTEDAILVTQHAANFLVSEARKSRTRPDEQEVLDNLIYNYQPTYGGKAGRGYDEVYIFT
ncbi:gamma-glutamyl hydrolase 2 isoform X2 [Neltuma alba]|uniref:gamma-glutamyl hydrolase 2 isoform X2 n=1 Tax=Neltuma alba TaxID=207710 RepID=UPI0010A44F8F|nr:gamma-glutamyl hydrolase 2-like isoform X2 [Prosopis alba]